MKLRCCLLGAIALCVGILSAHLSGATIATFADPTDDETTPLFTVDFAQFEVTGGWSDDQTGLTFQVPLLSASYPDAYFTMTDLVYSGTSLGGTTGAGAVAFYEDNQDEQTQPLFQIDFDVAHVTVHGIGGDNIFFLSADNVVFSGSIIDTMTASPYSYILQQESFSFSFANQAVYGSGPDGYTATASFTSSAEVVPEPATLTLLGLGLLAAGYRRR